MVLRGSLCTLRPWRLDDIATLPGLANDPEVVRYMLHRFPSPYTYDDADDWIRPKLGEPEPLHWAIEAGGALAGGIGLTVGTLERAGSVMIGYWIAKRFWGRGLATDALHALTGHALATLRPHRLWANVMAPNAASARVLEKAGYVHEAVLARSLVDRRGTVHDELVFVFAQAAADVA